MLRANDSYLSMCALSNPMLPLQIMQCDTLPMRLSSPFTSCWIWVPEIYKTFHNFVVYPNPTQDVLSLNFTSDVLQKNYIKIYDIWGKEVFEQKFETNYGNNTIRMNVSKLEEGIYCIGINSNDGKLFYKFIKE
jgi:hypothetical protein